MVEDVTNTEILEFLQEHMVTREEFSGLEGKADGLEQRFDRLETRMGGLEVKINQTKLDLIDAMDDKLADLKGDLVILMRKGDHKLAALVEVLREKEVLTEQDVHRVLSMEPFPKF